MPIVVNPTFERKKGNMRNIRGKKLLVSLAAAVATLGMAVCGAQVANAANSTGRDDVSISVTGEATKDRTYHAIKLADYSNIDASQTPVTLTVTTVGDATVKAAASSALTGIGVTTNDDPMSYVADHMGLDSRTGTAYAGTLRDFVMKLSQNPDIITAMGASTITASSTLVDGVQAARFTGLEDGVYLIEDSSAPAAGAINTLPILLSTKVGGLGANQPQGVTDTVEVKANYPGKPDKSTSKASYNVGDLVDFTIKTTVPTYTNYVEGTYVLKVNDTLSKGLSYSASRMGATVSIDGHDLTMGTDYTINTEATSDPNPGPVSFAFDLSPYMKGRIHASDFSLAGKQIVIKYKAILNEDAVSVIYPNGADTPQGSVHNDAKVTFTNDPSDTNGGKVSETPDGTSLVYTYKLQINKVDKASDKPLEGARFTVSGVNGDLSFIKQADGSYRTPMPGETGAVGYVESPANGEIKIEGLSEGTYKITETQAPTKDVDHNATNKYKLIAGSNFDAAINATYKSDKTLDTLSYSLSRRDAAGLASLMNASKGVFKVQNVQSLSQLPLTGAYGIAFLVSVGLLLIVGGGALYLVARKRDQNADVDGTMAV